MIYVVLLSRAVKSAFVNTGKNVWKLTPEQINFIPMNTALGSKFVKIYIYTEPKKISMGDNENMSQLLLCLFSSL